MKTVLAVCILIIMVSYTHPIHICLTNIDYNENENSFTLAIKIFTDDFQSIIEKKYGHKIDVNKDFTDNEKKIIDQYLSEHFNFAIDNKKVPFSEFTFKEKKTNFEAIWFYYELLDINKINKIRLRSSFLDDLYPDQKNLVILKVKNINKGYQFIKEDKSIEVEF